MLTADLTPAQLEEIRERRAAASDCEYWHAVVGDPCPGPVELFGAVGSGGVAIGEIYDFTDNAAADAEFVAHAYQDVPALLSHIARQSATIAALREALKDATAHLAGAASAYRTYARRHASHGRPPADALFSTRADDFDRATERARAALSGEKANG